MDLENYLNVEKLQEMSNEFYSLKQEQAKNVKEVEKIEKEVNELSKQKEEAEQNKEIKKLIKQKEDLENQLEAYYTFEEEKASFSNIDKSERMEKAAENTKNEIKNITERIEEASRNNDAEIKNIDAKVRVNKELLGIINKEMYEREKRISEIYDTLRTNPEIEKFLDQYVSQEYENKIEEKQKDINKRMQDKSLLERFNFLKESKPEIVPYLSKIVNLTQKMNSLEDENEIHDVEEQLYEAKMNLLVDFPKTLEESEVDKFTNLLLKNSEHVKTGKNVNINIEDAIDKALRSANKDIKEYEADLNIYKKSLSYSQERIQHIETSNKEKDENKNMDNMKKENTDTKINVNLPVEVEKSTWMPKWMQGIINGVKNTYNNWQLKSSIQKKEKVMDELFNFFDSKQDVVHALSENVQNQLKEKYQAFEKAEKLNLDKTYNKIEQEIIEIYLTNSKDYRNLLTPKEMDMLKNKEFRLSSFDKDIEKYEKLTGKNNKKATVVEQNTDSKSKETVSNKEKKGEDRSSFRESIEVNEKTREAINNISLSNEDIEKNTLLKMIAEQKVTRDNKQAQDEQEFTH